MIRFADDIAIVVETEADFKHIMERMEEIIGNEYRLMINKGKTNVMVCDKKGYSTVHLEMNEETKDDVKEFQYLGSRVTKDSTSKRNKMQDCTSQNILQPKETSSAYNKHQLGNKKKVILIALCLECCWIDRTHFKTRE